MRGLVIWHLSFSSNDLFVPAGLALAVFAIGGLFALLSRQLNSPFDAERTPATLVISIKGGRLRVTPHGKEPVHRVASIQKVVANELPLNAKEKICISYSHRFWPAHSILAAAGLASFF